MNHISAVHWQDMSFYNTEASGVQVTYKFSAVFRIFKVGVSFGIGGEGGKRPDDMK